MQFRHTTVPHRRHSPTMSRAHDPTRPLVMRPIFSPLGPMVLLFQALRMERRPSARRGPGVVDSFEQRRARVMSCERYCRRFARNWRQVRDSSWRVFRSSREASWETMLGWMLVYLCLRCTRDDSYG